MHLVFVSLHQTLSLTLLLLPLFTRTVRSANLPEGFVIIVFTIPFTLRVWELQYSVSRPVGDSTLHYRNGSLKWPWAKRNYSFSWLNPPNVWRVSRTLWLPWCVSDSKFHQENYRKIHLWRFRALNSHLSFITYFSNYAYDRCSVCVFPSHSIRRVARSHDQVLIQNSHIVSYFIFPCCCPPLLLCWE